MENKKTENLDLGQMAKNGNYEDLYNKLVVYEKNAHEEIDTSDLAILTDKRGLYSELEALLFHMMRFAKKPVPKKEKEEEESNNQSANILNNILTSLGGNSNVAVVPSKSEEDTKVELAPYFLEVVDFILRNGANPNTPVINGITPFMIACTINNADVMKKMVENPYTYLDLNTFENVTQKADVNKGDGRGNRPLYYATMTQATEVMDVLVNKYNVNINEQFFLGENKTVFHHLCQNFGDNIIVEADGLTFKQGFNIDKNKALDKLIELQADPTILDNYENMPEQLVPTFDEEIHSEGDVSPEDLKIWDDAYEKVGNYRKNYEATVKVSRKLVF